jgi:type I restriction enzyme R subunit
MDTIQINLYWGTIVDLNELQTRLQKIDVMLREQGWDVNDPSRVKIEIDTKQSDFVGKKYKTVDETLKNNLESKYADYLLLDSTGAPLAIVEAKRTCKDPRIGQKQAEEYANDIRRQTGRDVFIFLSNGYEIYFWDRCRYPSRQVKGFHSQRDLERIRFQSEHGKTAEPVEVKTDIVNRAKGIECVKRVVEHLHKGNRKALMVMATGTGKTRAAMAIVEILMRENLVQKVLFLADRKVLRDQAFNKGFKQFFDQESKEKISAGTGFDRSKRLYASTIQTFQEIYLEKDAKGQFKISPGEFDLIISDEAHRSIYNKWKDVFTYFDAIQIGLTATPSEMIDRDTLRFFGCYDGSPTVLYSYDEAVRDGVLADFRKSILGAQTHFQIAGIKPSDIPEGEKAKLIAQGYDPDEVNFDGSELEKQVAVKGTAESHIREFMENALLDQAEMLPAKTIFFAVSKKHAWRLLEAFDTLYPEYKGRLARVIVSEDPRADVSIREFENENFPRVAISVDMLDTGIDVEEVCNLVFAKPVFSKIKFWQMLGRGTRSDAVCEHREWLPNGKKEYFKVFDFFENFERQQIHPQSAENEPTEAITSRIFLVKLKKLAHFHKIGDKNGEIRMREQIDADIKALPMDSVSVREHRREIETALSPNLWDNVGINPVEFLTKNIMPLMRFQPEVNLNMAIFTLRCEQLALAALSCNAPEIERLKKPIAEMVNRLPLTLEKVKVQESLIKTVLSSSFWNSVSFEGAERMREDLAPLMVYAQREPREIIVIDMGDAIEQRTLISMEGEKEHTYITKYRERVEERVRQIADSNPVIQKIARDEVLSESDLRSLELALFSSDFVLDEQEITHTGAAATENVLVPFIKRVLGMYATPDPRMRIKDAFQTFIIAYNKHYTADQLNFIRMVESVFSSKHHITYADFWDPPFTTLGTTAPLPMFADDDLHAFVGICSMLERELYAAEA